MSKAAIKTKEKITLLNKKGLRKYLKPFYSEKK